MCQVITAVFFRISKLKTDRPVIDQVAVKFKFLRLVQSLITFFFDYLGNDLVCSVGIIY